MLKTMIAFFCIASIVTVIQAQTGEQPVRRSRLSNTDPVKSASSIPDMASLKKTDLPAASGVSSLFMDDVYDLSPVSVPVSRVVRFIKNKPREKWLAFYYSGRQMGYSYRRLEAGTYRKKPVIIRVSRIVFPSSSSVHNCTWYFDASGTGELLRISYKERGRHKESSVMLEKKGDIWEGFRNVNGNETRIRMRSIEETLGNNDIAMRVMLSEGSLKPGDRFRLSWLDPGKLANRYSGNQVLAKAAVSGLKERGVVYKVESLLPQSRQHWKHIYTSSGDVLVSRYGPRALYLSSEENALRMDGDSRNFIEILWHKHPQILIFIIIGMFFAAYYTIRNFYRKRS